MKQFVETELAIRETTREIIRLDELRHDLESTIYSQRDKINSGNNFFRIDLQTGTVNS